MSCPLPPSCSGTRPLLLLLDRNGLKWTKTREMWGGGVPAIALWNSSTTAIVKPNQGRDALGGGQKKTRFTEHVNSATLRGVTVYLIKHEKQCLTIAEKDTTIKDNGSNYVLQFLKKGSDILLSLFRSNNELQAKPAIITRVFNFIFLHDCNYKVKLLSEALHPISNCTEE